MKTRLFVCAIAAAFSIMFASAVLSAGGLAFINNGSVYFLPDGAEKPIYISKGGSVSLKPDASALAYAAEASPISKTPVTDIFSVDLNTLETHKVTSCKGKITDISWNNDGKRILYLHITTRNQYEISTFDTISEAEWSTSSAGNPEGDLVFTPVWGSDGKSILYHNNVSLCRIALDGEIITKTKLDSFTGRKSSVTSTDRFVENPDGSGIMAFTRMAEGTKFGLKVFKKPTSALFTYDVNTKKLKRITKPEIIAMNPCWSRDGKFIYFSGYDEKDYAQSYPFKIYRINPDGTGLAMIAKGEAPSL